jgi:hypothetical protein
MEDENNEMSDKENNEMSDKENNDKIIVPTQLGSQFIDEKGKGLFVVKSITATATAQPINNDSNLVDELTLIVSSAVNIGSHDVQNVSLPAGTYVLKKVIPANIYVSGSGSLIIMYGGEYDI